MQYEELEPLTKKEAEALMQSGERDHVVRGLLRAALHVDDVPWVTSKAVEYIGNSDYWVQNACVLCFAHLARIHGIVDFESAQQVLKQAAQNPRLAGIVEDAIGDIRMFADKSFSIATT